MSGSVLQLKREHMILEPLGTNMLVSDLPSVEIMGLWTGRIASLAALMVSSKCHKPYG